MVADAQEPKVVVDAGSDVGRVVLHAQNSGFTLQRDGSTIDIEPYASNIIRVTLNTR